MRLTDRGVRLRRQAGHLLHRPRARAVADVVRHIVAIQAQDRRAGMLAIRARTTTRTQADVEAALTAERSVVWTWAMRGTLHFLAAEDHDWLLALTAPAQLTTTFTRLSQEGVTHPERAVGLLERMLEDGPMTVPEIRERLRRGGIPTQGQALAHIVRLAALRGLAFRGPMQGSTHTHVLVRDWVAPSSPPRDPFAELAVRYLRSHGPATPEDLATWAGIRLGDARDGWKAIAGRLTEVATTRGPMWMLRSRAKDPPKGVLRLAPAFEPYLLGWKRRDLALAPEDASRVIGGGVFRPVVIADGLVTGGWALERERKGFRLEVRRFAPGGSRAVLEAEARDVGRFLDVPVILDLR